jgi:hypothetical protein
MRSSEWLLVIASESQYREVATVPGLIPASSDTVVAEGRQIQQNENRKKGENTLLKNIKNKQSGPP